MAERIFYTMGEVAEMFDVNTSLIRHWETQFPMLRPKRNKKGNRLFTPQDVEYLKMIYHLVKECGMTLDGAKKALRKGSSAKGLERDMQLMEHLQRIRAMLVEVREDLKASEGELVDDDEDLLQESDPALAEIPFMMSAKANVGASASELPVEEPAETPDAEPDETPDAEPTETPDAEPTEAPDAEPAETPDAEPTETPDAEPAETPDAEPAETPDAGPAENPGAEETEAPDAGPAENPGAAVDGESEAVHAEVQSVDVPSERIDGISEIESAGESVGASASGVADGSGPDSGQTIPAMFPEMPEAEKPVGEAMEPVVVVQPEEGPGQPTLHAARKSRRKKDKEEVENKELFAFYEQSLF